MATFSDVTDVEAALTRLAEREDGPFVTRLAREPGRRDARFAHLLSGPVADSAHGASAASAPPSHSAQSSGASLPGGRISAPEVTFPASLNDERLTKLEAEVQSLREELAELKSRLGES